MFDHAFHKYLQHGFPMVSRDVALVIVVLSLHMAPDKCDAVDSDAGVIPIGRLLPIRQVYLHRSSSCPHAG